MSFVKKAAGFVGDVLTGSTETTTTPVLSPEQQKLTGQQVELGEFQLEELQRQRDAQAESFGAAETSLDAFDEFVAGQTGDTAQLDAAQDELLQDMLKRIRAGGEATPLEIELINSATEQALALGESDISRFLKEGLTSLREELAPQLGLRPSDTPILDRGGRVVEESTRQQGQLVRDLRGQQFASRLGFPLQRAATLGGLNLGQQGIAQDIKAFQAQLKQGAFINRLQLAGGRASAGLGLAGVSAPNIGPLFNAVGSVGTGRDPSGAISGLLGGAGGLAKGISGFFPK